MDNEPVDWKEVWNSLECSKEGERRARVCQAFSEDSRKPRIPAGFDNAWKAIDQWVAWFFFLPWMAIATYGSWRGGVFDMFKSTEAFWSAFVDTALLAMVFYGAVFFLRRASKASWNGRWAGPEECAKARSLSGRDKNAEKWLKQAQRRGIRCADVEMAHWICYTGSHLDYERTAAERKRGELLAAQQAFEEMNQNRLEALREKADLAAHVGEANMEKRSSNRL